jgi:hypothetical protein
MPTHVTKRKGHVISAQWGKHGKVYKGSNAKSKADRQGRAILANMHKNHYWNPLTG